MSSFALSNTVSSVWIRYLKGVLREDDAWKTAEDPERQDVGQAAGRVSLQQGNRGNHGRMRDVPG
ncbi:hypothetical protein ABZ756_00470 [Mammaliicoccus sciuri]